MQEVPLTKDVDPSRDQNRLRSSSATATSKPVTLPHHAGWSPPVSRRQNQTSNRPGTHGYDLADSGARPQEDRQRVFQGVTVSETAISRYLQDVGATLRGLPQAPRQARMTGNRRGRYRPQKSSATSWKASPAIPFASAALPWRDRRAKLQKMLRTSCAGQGDVAALARAVPGTIRHRRPTPSYHCSREGCTPSSEMLILEDQHGRGPFQHRAVGRSQMKPSLISDLWSSGTRLQPLAS